MSAKAEKYIAVKRTKPEQIVVDFDAERLKAPFLLRCGSFLNRRKSCSGRLWPLPIQYEIGGIWKRWGLLLIQIQSLGGTQVCQ